ncbi:MAG: hypothetical protein GXP15_16870 [Gammaproteobacteria bacterium]|nr:hypothetical protein [Gammaproteobacteria bacterium]
MSAEQLKRSESATVKAIKPSRPAFFDPSTLSWAPWAMEGTYFKLLNVDMKTGGFTMLLKVDPDNAAPVHGHPGAVEVYVVEGEFGYGDDRGGVGAYGYEAAGSVHEPTSPGGTVMFAVAHGPIVGYNDDGSIAGIIDGQSMLALAREHDVAEHLSHL